MKFIQFKYLINCWVKKISPRLLSSVKNSSFTQAPSSIATPSTVSTPLSSATCLGDLRKYFKKTGVIFSKHKPTWLWLCDWFLFYCIYYCVMIHISWLGIIVCLNLLLMGCFRIQFSSFSIYFCPNSKRLDRYYRTFIIYRISYVWCFVSSCSIFSFFASVHDNCLRFLDGDGGAGALVT